jgi:N-succinyldiaminopimelate aminotransferase
MSRRPRFAAHVEAMPGAVYSPFADAARRRGDEIHSLHVGDTWIAPFEGGRLEDLSTDAHPGLHNYCDTRGWPALVDAIVGKVRERNDLLVEREQVLVSAGATAGLSCVAGALLEPGDEVLILSPFWPLIRGIVQAFGGRPVEVPFYDRVKRERSAVDVVRAHLSDRTVALYVSTPSNPTGAVLPGDWLEALAAFARESDLWVLSDEVYESLVYGGEHVSMGRFAPERTVSCFSFSKTYGMAGNRVGYVVGPEPLIEQARKIGTHTYYNAPTGPQISALRALEGGSGWVESARASYADVGRRCAARLGLPAPGGSTFLFVNVERHLDERGLDGLLADLFEDGVLVAPGASSGQGFEHWIRLCYTAEPPDRVLEAVDCIAARLEGAASKSR